MRRIDLGDEHFLFVDRGLRDYLPERIGDKGRSPELESIIRRAFKSDDVTAQT